MELTAHVSESVVLELHRLLPGFPLNPKVTPIPQTSQSGLGTPDEAVSMELPVPVGADYSFELYFLPERQIHARLLNSDFTHRAFWYMPFEEAGYSNSLERVDEAFLRAIENILRHQTRIIQQHGLLFESFTCDYSDDASWQRLYGMSYLRKGGFKVPRIAERKKIYSSPPISALGAGGVYP